MRGWDARGDPRVVITHEPGDKLGVGRGGYFGVAACFPYPLAILDGAQSESDGGPATSYSFGDKGVDLPMRFAFPNPSNGGLSLVGDSAEALTRIIGATSAALPTCRQERSWP